MQMHVISSLLYKMQCGNIRYLAEYMVRKKQICEKTRIFSKCFAKLLVMRYTFIKTNRFNIKNEVQKDESNFDHCR